MDRLDIKIRPYWQAECQTCGWVSSRYFFDSEGGEDCAKASIVIETRLGHLNETAECTDGRINCHQIEYKVIRE